MVKGLQADFFSGLGDKYRQLLRKLGIGNQDYESLVLCMNSGSAWIDSYRNLIINFDRLSTPSVID